MVFSSSSYAQAIEFSNGGEQVTITNGQIKGTPVVLSNRIIVKVDKSLSKNDLKGIDAKITNVSQIYQGKAFDFYLAEITTEPFLVAVMQKLSKQAGVQLVQPDILQLRSKNNINTNANRSANTLLNENKHSPLIYPPYIKFYGIKKRWNKTKGAGVNVAIIDDGFDLSHPKFKALNVVFSYDVNQKTLSSLPISPLDTHGTKVAGIIFAQHDNDPGKGEVNGIAPEASLIAIRQPDTWTSNTLVSFQVAKLEGADVINCSWHSHFLLQPVADVINDLSFHGRNGKGIAVVISAGNDNQQITRYSSESAISSAIVVGAVNELNHQKLSFSNYGQSVDLMMYGKSVKSLIVGGGYGRFAGTSLSAAIVSGISALIIAEKPDITLKQLTDKLAQLQHRGLNFDK